VLTWLDLPAAQRPALTTLYFDIVDTMGHHHGPDAPQTLEATRSVDASIGRLVEGLKARGLYENTILVVVSDHGMANVPDGQTMAKKTTNARLGILGGISILGTTGIVKPYSTAAWRASVVQGVQVAATTGHDVVALTTGGRTETFAIGALRAERPELPSACFVQMGDFLRYALDEAVAQGIGTVVLAVMVGKLTKIAQGETITHANRSEVDTDLVAAIARQIGATPEDCEAMAAAETARFGAELMVERGLGDAFHHALAQAAIDTLTAPDRYGRAFQLRVLVCDFSGVQVADVWSLPALPQERPASAGRIGIDHLPEADTFHQ